jgi:hypothetical protein
VHLATLGVRVGDLAAALVAGHDRLIFVDACPHGMLPGTVFANIDPLHTRLQHVVIVGCEPAMPGREDVAANEVAVAIELLIAQFLNEPRA